MLITLRPPILTPPVARLNPPSPRFGACVNAGTKAQAAMDLLLKGNLEGRLHVVAELGRAGTADLTQVLKDLLLGKKDMLAAIKDEDRSDRLKKVTIMALVDAHENGSLTDEEKADIVKTLEEAQEEGYMKNVKELLEEAIHRLKGEPADKRHLKDAEHEHRHAKEGGHHHHH